MWQGEREECGGGVEGLSGSDSCQCLFCNRGACLGRGDYVHMCMPFAHLFTFFVCVCACMCALCGFIYSVGACFVTDSLML